MINFDVPRTDAIGYELGFQNPSQRTEATLVSLLKGDKPKDDGRSPLEDIYSPIEQDIKIERVSEKGISDEAFGFVCLSTYLKNTGLDAREQTIMRRYGFQKEQIESWKAEALDAFGVKNISQAGLLVELGGMLPFSIPSADGTTMSRDFLARSVPPSFNWFRGDFNSYFAKVAQGNRAEDVAHELKVRKHVERAYTILGVDNAAQGVRVMRDYGNLPLITSLDQLLDKQATACPPFSKDMLDMFRNFSVGRHVLFRDPTVEPRLKRMLGVTGETYGLESLARELAGNEVARFRQTLDVEEQTEQVAALPAELRRVNVIEPSPQDLVLARMWVLGMNTSQIVANDMRLSMGAVNEALMRVKKYLGDDNRTRLRIPVLALTETTEVLQ